MTIYKRILGEEFYRLHPKLQERYTLTAQNEFKAVGRMKTVKSGRKWLYPFLLLMTKWKFLFPESGKDIPFEIVNRSRSIEGKEEILWERVFYFPNVTRRFHARMLADHENRVVQDYLGEPSLFYSDLVFEVIETGSLRIRSAAQRLVLGKWEIPLPSWLEGRVNVVEAYDDQKERFTISVSIHNILLGPILFYEGEFREEGGNDTTSRR